MVIPRSNFLKNAYFKYLYVQYEYLQNTEYWHRIKSLQNSTQFLM